MGKDRGSAQDRRSGYRYGYQQDQGRPDRRRIRYGDILTRIADRREACDRLRSVCRQDYGVQGREDQRSDQECRGIPQGAYRKRYRSTTCGDHQQIGERPGVGRYDQEYHRFRRLYGPRWSGWSAVYHRYQLGPYQPSERGVEARSEAAGGGVGFRRWQETYQPRFEAADPASVGCAA